MSNRAYYSRELVQFLIEPIDSIIGAITQCHSQNLEYQQTGAWVRQIEILQIALQSLNEGHILFEVQIPRMGRRADTVLIYKNIIFVIEFKVGATQYLPQDLRQTHGYAIDLYHFHEGSHGKTIIPILVATEAQTIDLALPKHVDDVYEPITANKENLYAIILRCVNYIQARQNINYQDWLHSSYKLTPTIIEAAQALYSSHDVEDIARNDAGAQNLHLTSTTIQEIVHAARSGGRKAICFVTGVPGAGKTLVGLNIATSTTDISDDEHAVFLSGNGPLVDVLIEALARDSVKRSRTQSKPNISKENALRSASAKIQNIHRFRDESLKDFRKAPPERVVVFDEAQRA